MAEVKVKRNPLLELQQCGQSVWLDSYRREWVTSGELKRMIDEDGLRGITINPTIFYDAISAGTDYDEPIRELAGQGKSNQEIYESLITEDIRMAADLFRPLYDSLDGADGLVSIELPPSLAYDTIGSITEAHRLRRMIDRENIMIKVPGTAQGVPAIEELTYDGINVNVTLLFSIEDYVKVAYAYLRGLGRRVEDGEKVGRIASVASFFVSRIDTKVDNQLKDMISKEQDTRRRDELDSLIGKAAIANAKMAYQRYKEIFTEEQFGDLRDQGARVQRVLWASTSTKDPRFPDVYYVENLIGPDTVDTMPYQTLSAFRDHGKVCPTLEEGLDEARNVLQKIAQAGINLDEVTRGLQTEGVIKFQKSVDEMNACLDAKR